MLTIYYNILGYTYQIKKKFGTKWDYVMILMSHCKHCILYPLRLEPSFSNDAEILRAKVGLWSN